MLSFSVEMLIGCIIVEFFNGHNTDKAHPFIEDSISKQQPLVKVTNCILLGVCFILILHIWTLQGDKWESDHLIKFY